MTQRLSADFVKYVLTMQILCSMLALESTYTKNIALAVYKQDETRQTTELKIGTYIGFYTRPKANVSLFL